MTPETFDNLTWRLLDGELQEAEREAFERALAADPALKARFEEARALDAACRRALATPTPDAVRADLWAGFDARLAADARPAPRPTLRRNPFIRTLVPALASAAAVVLALWAGGLFDDPAPAPVPTPVAGVDATWYADSPVIDAVVVADTRMRERLGDPDGTASWERAVRRVLADEGRCYLGENAVDREARLAELRELMEGCTIAPFDPATLPEELEIECFRSYEARIEGFDFPLVIPQFFLRGESGRVSVHVLCAVLAEQVLGLIGCLEPDCRLGEGQPSRPFPIEGGHVVVLKQGNHILLLVSALPAARLAAVAALF